MAKHLVLCNLLVLPQLPTGSYAIHSPKPTDASHAGEFEDGPLTQDAAMPHSVADGEDRGLVGLLKGSEKPKASPSKPSSGKRKRGAEDPEVAKAEMAELEVSSSC